MANFNLTITNEGAAFLADVIANQGSIDFTEVRFSSTNYVGSEATLTAGTFGGTWLTVTPSASVVDQTTINVASSFDNSGFSAAKTLYSIGLIGEDGNGNTALVAVCTKSTPDTIPAYVAPASTYDYNINLTVSDTENITITATPAGVLFVSDIVDNLNSYATNKPLSANQGRALKALIAASGLPPHVIITTTTGATVTLTLGGTTIIATETSSGIFEADVNEYGTWTITAVLGADTVSTTLNVDVVKIYNVNLSFWSATIVVNYPDDMKGQSFTCEKGGTIFTETAPNDANTLSFYPDAPGEWTVTGAYSKKVTLTTDGETQTISFVALKTFAAATDAELAAMVTEADLGYLDLADDCGWAVGQEHQVSLSAINATGTYDGVSWTVGESQSAQTVTFVLMHKGLYELVTPVLDKQGQARNTCSFILGLKDCLDTVGYINSTNDNTASWEGCSRRNWCNGGFYGALPSDFRGMLKKFKCITGDYDGTDAGGANITTQDFIALAAEKEVTDINTYSTTNEFNALTTFTYYQTAANRIKKVNGVAADWWERSPQRNHSEFWSGVGANGLYKNGRCKDATYGLAPIACL